MRTKQELYQAALRTVALRRQTARANAEDARLEAEAAIPALRQDVYKRQVYHGTKSIWTALFRKKP